MGKNRKKRDPMAPKRPVSAFLEFSRDERPKILAELGPKSFGEVGKELGIRWRNLSENQKAVFEEKEKANVEKHRVEMEKYLSRPRETENQELPVEEIQCDTATSIASQLPSLIKESTSEHSVAVSEPVAPPNPPDPKVTCDILATDLGFAKQRGYSWHPALKTASNARGSRISVTYFGTAETGVVDQDKWLLFSPQAEAKILTPALLKKVAFRRGMDQLKNVYTKITNSDDKSVPKADIEFPVQPVGRKLVKLSKEGLQKDEEQNIQLMKEKIIEISDKKYKFECRDCQWRGKYAHKAKAHARDCGSRRRENKKKPKSHKYMCSKVGCDLTFPYLDQLQKHYREFHFQSGKRGYNCIPCKKAFKSWKCFRRHNVLNHGQHENFSCDSCTYKTNRKDNLTRHTRKMHGSQGVVSSLISDIISELVGQKDVLEEGIEAAEDDGLSPYERIRNERVAEIRKKFRSLFEEELQELEMKKRRVKARRKKTQSMEGKRKSFRYAEDCASMSGDKDVHETSENGVEEAVPVSHEEDDHVNQMGGNGAEFQLEADLCGQAGGDMGQVSDAKFGCIPCGMKFRDMANMRRHVKLIHEPKPIPVSCPRTWCKSTFSTMADMFKHRKTCLLVCPECGKTFQKVARFDAHQRYHKTLARRMADW